MKKPIILKSVNTDKGFSLIEILVAIVIIAILASLTIGALETAKTTARAAISSASMKEIVNGTILWAGENGNRLPSPQYPGGMVVPNGMSQDQFFPQYWDKVPGSGLWLDGVVFGQLYLKTEDERVEDSGGVATGGGYQMDEAGTHLIATHFESKQSTLKFPEEKNWHRHSYAMNKNIQFDLIHRSSGSPDPWLTEKTLSNIVFAPNAMVYIECIEQNVVDFTSRDLIVETATKRWGGNKVIAGFLDGHVERILVNEIPLQNPQTDRISSRFWRGVDP